jgi:hypothetical protein
MKSWLHNALGRLWHAIGRLLARTKRWDRT